MKSMLLVSACLLGIASSLADTTFVSGTIVSQTWTTAGSPYVVIGNVVVAGLTIHPGVRVLFQGDYTFEVGGILAAEGTTDDSITFGRSGSAPGWNGIFFNLGAPGSTLAYCVISGSSNTGIRIANTDVTIEHCSVRGNSGQNGGGVRGTGSVTLSACEIAHNVVSVAGNGSIARGGGISVDGHLVLSNCTIARNAAMSYVSGSDGSCNTYGGGVYTSGSCIFANCFFGHNLARATGQVIESGTATSFGGGLYAVGISRMENCVFGYDTTIATHSGFAGGSTTAGGGAMFGPGGSARAVNCTFAYNAQRGVRAESDTTTLNNCIVYYNALTPQVTGGAIVTSSNVQGGSTGSGNIDRNPVFGSPTNLQIVPGSPCVDAGDSSSIFDDACFPPSLGTSRNDMGAHGGPHACGWGPPGFSAAPPKIDFGDVDLGAHKRDSVFVRNSGTTKLIITTVVSSDSQFEVTPVACVLAPKGIQKFDMTFRPTQAAAIKGWIEFRSNLPDGPDTIRVNGVGISPLFSVDAREVTFGQVRVGQSKVDSIIVSNPGTGELRISGVAASGDNFRVSPNSAGILPAGRATFHVTFAPTSTGPSTGTITFVHNAITSPDTLQAAGIGVSPIFRKNRTVVSFGKVVAGSIAADSVLVWNPGNIPLVISGIVASRREFIVWPESATVAPLDTMTFSLAFHTADVGLFTGQMVFYHDGPDAPDTLWLSGSSIPSETDSLHWVQNPVSRSFKSRFFGSVTSGEYIFSLGGDSSRYSGNSMNYVGSSKIQPDGTLGEWRESTPLPYRVSDPGAAVHGNYIYVVGGFDSASRPRADVFKAIIGKDGTVGDWQSQAALPEGHYGHSVVVKDSTLYVLGGLNDPAVHYSRIDGNGDLGPWKNTTSLPGTGLFGAGAVVHGGRIYVLGGAHHTPTFSITVAVQYAEIQPDGTLEGWNPVDSLPAAEWFLGVASFQNKIIIAGGAYANTPNAEVLQGTVNDNGQVAWKAIGAVPLASLGGGLLVTNNTAYYFAGESEGFETHTEIFYARFVSTDINAENKHLPISRFSLSQNYPNPFNPATHIRFSIPTDEFVALKVYDVLGREVAAVIDEPMTAGSYGADLDGSALPSGVYFYMLQAGSFRDIKKFIIMK